MTAQRMVYLSFATIVALGILLTGYNKVSWVLYIPVVMGTLAGLTGKCGMLSFWQKCGLK